MNNPTSHPVDHVAQNARAWDALARKQASLARPAKDEEFANPLATIDPLSWLGGDIHGWNVLCLAAGGGRQSALYATAGAEVTVVDISGEMLALDRQVAAERQLSVRSVQTSMDELSMFADGEFDAVIHPVSTCYVPDVAPVFREAARVCRAGGLYVSQHKSPVSLQVPPGAGVSARGCYELVEAYYRDAPLPAVEGTSRLRERGTVEFLHRWEQLIGGICRAGFVVEDLIEPMHADEQSAFGERAKFVAPYVRIKARRTGSAEPRAAIVTRP